MLIIKNRGVNNSLFYLAAEGFTKVNPVEIAGENPPYGVLAGSVAALDKNAAEGEYIATAGNGTNRPIGLFLNNAEGAPFENAPAVASGKVAVFMRGDCEVDLFEPGEYAVGDELYGSANGFLTNVKPEIESNSESDSEAATADETVIGIVTKVPTTAEPTLGVKMLI